MRTRTHLTLIVAALLGGGTARASAQNPGAPSIDARWIAYIGCWQQVESAKSQLCIVPAGASAVELLTIAKGDIVSRERIDASGARVTGARGDCSTWQSAEWSTIAARLYLRSGDKCATGDGHSGTGVIAMGTTGEWLYVQGMTLGGQTGVRVERYREAPSDLVVPNEVTDALRQKLSGIIEARAAAATPLGIEDVIDASQHVDAAVLQAWLVERREPIPVDAKRLVALADARVPSGVIDVMVALSYPKVFAINPMSRRGELLSLAAPGVAGATSYGMVPLCSSFYPLDFYQSLYDCGYYYRGYGYPYDNGSSSGFYPGTYAPTVVYVGGGSSQGHGRIVNGHGYQGSGGGGNGNVAEPRRSDTGGSTSSGAATTSSSSGSPSGSSSGNSSSSSGGEQRTAHPRPPQ